MKKSSETGHAKNAANFETLIGFCRIHNAAYNPSNPLIIKEALEALLAKALAALDALKQANTELQNATNAREIAFKPLKKISTRVVGALKASGATLQTVADAKASNQKIQGRRAAAVKKVEAKEGEQPLEEEKNISTSQQSFDNQLDNFTKLHKTITAEPLFKPNETDVQVQTLTNLIDDLRTKNTAVIDAYAKASLARINRDKIFYSQTTGLYDVSQTVKDYFKSLFGASSPEYKQVAGIRIVNMK